MTHGYSHELSPVSVGSRPAADATGTTQVLHYRHRHRSGSSTSQDYVTPERNDMVQDMVLHSNAIEGSTPLSASSLESSGHGEHTIPRKPLPGTLQGPMTASPIAEVQPTRIGRGVWKDQLLVDRSLRGMAALMTAFAIALLIIVATNMKPLTARTNRSTSSVGGKSQGCATVTRTNTGLLLLINIAATMVLGMSNTYQQLVTSLKVGDLKHMLQKLGDSRVGTNSPFSINHKNEGRKSSWATWTFLIITSMPVHFLANSLIGPSYLLRPPSKVDFVAVASTYIAPSDKDVVIAHGSSFVCWSAFRTGKVHFADGLYQPLTDYEDLYSQTFESFGIVYDRLVVRYHDSRCTQYLNDTIDISHLKTNLSPSIYTQSYAYKEGQCDMGDSVYCTLHDPRPAQCRLNVRMNAAFVLLGCLTFKAIYMIAVNLLARGKVKRHCMTFGDVIVASASDPDLHVQGECMVNANDSYRRHTSHTCHKHCRSKEASKTGDDLGHCQNCKKWNLVNKFSNKPQPTIATKIKKSLISNLGNTALIQMLILMFCSLVLLTASVLVAVFVGARYSWRHRWCTKDIDVDNSPCNGSDTDYLVKISGGFGGFNQSLVAASLPPDDVKSELISFCISNGAQIVYSLLYLLMIYNITLISQEQDWGKLEHSRKRLRCTIVKGDGFSQTYLLQLPKKILFPIMAYSVLTHWMLGEALQAQEAIWLEDSPKRFVEHSRYVITWAAYPLWFATVLILLMTGVCWWAFTYKREGFIPQMFGSIRVLCAATTSLEDFPITGIQWGDLGMGEQFRHAGLSAEEAGKIVPNELYTGTAAVAKED